MKIKVLGSFLAGIAFLAVCAVVVFFVVSREKRPVPEPAVSQPTTPAAEKPLDENETAMELDRIMQGFYRAPSPENATEYLKLLAGLREERILSALACNGVFLGEIFARCPDHLPQWIGIRGNEAFQATLKYALLYAGTKETKTAYCILTGTQRQDIPPAPADVSATKPEECTPMTLDSCWGGFFATGDKKYVVTVIKAAMRPIRPGVIDLTQRAALWSLLSLSDKHPPVKECLRETLRTASPQFLHDLAERISEAAQKELLGKVLISDEEKDRNDSEKQKRRRIDPVGDAARLKPEFFDALKKAKLSYRSDYLTRAAKPLKAELKRFFPDLPETEIDRIARNHLLLKDLSLPRKPPKGAPGFIAFYAMRIYMRDNPVNSRQKKMFLETGLKLAQNHPDDLTVAQMIFRELEATGVISLLTPDMLRRYRLHPYLSLMLQGERDRLEAWKHRGGGYADTVSTHGWQSFGEYLQKARVFFEEAARKYPSAPEAPALMLDVVGSGGGEDGEMIVWLKRALLAQADYPDAMNAFTWFNRPRWGGSTAQLLADAKAFFRQREDDPRLAQNGLHLLRAFLSEIPFIDCVRYFRGRRNYEEVKELFEALAKIEPLDSGQKMFLGTAALFADDGETADGIAAKLTPEDLAFANRLLYGSTPQIHWVDFPALHRALNRTGIRQELLRTLYYRKADVSAALLKKTIPGVADPADKQALIDLFIALKGKLDWQDFRGRMPMFLRLCAESKENMALIKEVIGMGADVNMTSPSGKRRALYYAMRDEESGELLEVLLAAGADPNAMWGDHTPLDYACHAHFPPARIRRLLEAGADPNRKYRKTFTALHASLGNPEGAKLLVEFGAKLNEVTEYGHTPLDLAEKMGSADVAKFLRSKGAKHASEL